MLLCLLKGPANTAAHSFPTWANPVPEDRIPAGFSVLQLHTAHPGVPAREDRKPGRDPSGEDGICVPWHQFQIRTESTKLVPRKDKNCANMTRGRFGLIL